MLATMFLNQMRTAKKLQGSEGSTFIATIGKKMQATALLCVLFLSSIVATAQTATITAVPPIICEGNLTTIIVTVTGLPSGVTVKDYDYFFLPGTPSNSLAPNASYQYVAGNYSPYVVVNLSSGGPITSNTLAITVYARPIPIFTNITADTQCFKTNNVCFQNSSIQPPPPSNPIAKYIWVYGDGFFDTAYTNANQCHRYTFPGVFNVSVRAIDAVGCYTDTFLKSTTPIVIKPKLEPSFTWFQRTGPCFISNYLFTNTTPVALNTLQSFTYDFGDGTQYTATAPFDLYEIQAFDTMGHDYNINGEFSPGMIVTDLTGCIDSIRYTSANAPKPIPKNIRFEFDVVTTKSAANSESRDSVCIGSYNTATICFKQTPIEFATGNFVWVFDDPNSQQLNFNTSSWNPCHTFVGGMKSYFVRLIISNVCGPIPISHTYYAGATFEEDIFLDKTIYANNDAFDANAAPRLVYDTVYRVNRRDPLRKLVYTGSYHMSAGSYLGEDTLYAYVNADRKYERPIYYISDDAKLFKAPGVLNDTITLPFDFITKNGSGDTLVGGYKYYGYGARVIGPTAQIEKTSPPPVVIAAHHKNQCGPTDTVDFVNTSSSFKSRKVYRLWDFDDNFAPQCTSFSRPQSGWPQVVSIQPFDSVTYDKGKTYMKFGPDTTRLWNNALEQFEHSDFYFIMNGQTYEGKMNCKFSYDTLPRHFYPNWDTIYRWYSGGHDFMPWDATTYGNSGPPRIPIDPADAMWWNKPVYLNPVTGEWSLTQNSGPAPFGLWTRIDTMEWGITDLKKGEPVQVRDLPDPFRQSLVDKNGKYPVISSARVEPGKSFSYTWMGKRYTINGSDMLPEGITFYQYAFRRTITRCITVRMNLQDSFNNESTKGIFGAVSDSAQLDSVDCKMEATVQLPFAKADARGLAKRGKECPGASPNGVFFQMSQFQQFPGILPSCGQSFILVNFDSLADRQDGTPCALDAFVSWQGGATPGGLATPPFFSAPNYNQPPTQWTSPSGTVIAWHYGLNAPANRPPPADTAQGWVTIGLAVGSGCKDSIRRNVPLSVYEANQAFYDADITAPVIYSGTNTPVPGAPTNYTYAFTGLINWRTTFVGPTLVTIVDVQYQDCAWPRCMSDTVWYHRFLRINNLSAKFEMEPANCRLRHKGESIRVHYEDTIQDDIKYSLWSWGDNTATVDSFYYLPDSFDVCLDSVKNDILLSAYKANPSFYQTPISYPIPANQKAPGATANNFNYTFAGLTNRRATFDGVSYDTLVDIVYTDCHWTDGYYLSGVRRVRYNFDIQNGIVLLDSTVWPVRASGIGATDGVKPGQLVKQVRKNNFALTYSVVSRTAVPGSIVAFNFCKGANDTIKNEDTLAYYPIVQTVDSAFAFFPVDHVFRRTSWEAAGKGEGVSIGSLTHLIQSRDPQNCVQDMKPPITIGIVDTFDILNGSGEKDTLFCENEPVYFRDSLRYWRNDCSVTDVQTNPAISNSQAYSGLLAPPFNDLQIDSADFWRQDVGDPRTIQNIVPYTPFTKWDAGSQQYYTYTKMDTIIPERVYWDFGDGSPIDSSMRPVHRYKQFGRYTVTMYSKDSLGWFDTCVAFLNISRPIAKIGFLKDANGNPIDKFTCGALAQFIDSTKMAESSTGDKVSDSVKTNYWWFGDKIDTSMWQSTNNPQPGVRYRTNGLFRIKLVAETYQGCKDTTTDTIFISGPRPYVQLLNMNDTIGCAPFKVKIINLADSLGKQVDANGDPITDTVTLTTIIFWGDKNNTQQNIFGRRDTVEFTYDTPGVYQIFVKGSDAAFGGANTCDLVLYPDTPNMPPIQVEVITLAREVLLDKEVICKGNPVMVQNNSDTRYSQYTYTYYLEDNSTAPIDSVTKNQVAPYSFPLVIDSVGSFTIIARPDNVSGIPLSAVQNCKINDTLHVDVVTPSPSFTVDTTAMPLFKLNNTSDTTLNVQYEWVVTKKGATTPSFTHSGNNQDPHFQFDLAEDTGTYVACLTSYAKGISLIEACTDSVCQTIVNTFSTDLEIPNVFSPNNDGLNDLFKIKILGEKQYKLVIYNRWGAKVFESDNQGLMWNGKIFNDGAESPPGAYYYIFDYQLRAEEPKTKTGTVTLIR